MQIWFGDVGLGDSLYGEREGVEPADGAFEGHSVLLISMPVCIIVISRRSPEGASESGMTASSVQTSSPGVIHFVSTMAMYAPSENVISSFLIVSACEPRKVRNVAVKSKSSPVRLPHCGTRASLSCVPVLVIVFILYYQMFLGWGLLPKRG